MADKAEAVEKQPVEDGAEEKQDGEGTEEDTAKDESLSEAVAIPEMVPWDADPVQSNLITILAIWNMMLGTSMLAMPWAMQQAGLALGPIITVAMAILTGYTCYRIVICQFDAKIPGEAMDFPSVMQLGFGKIPHVVTLIACQLLLFGAVITYSILLTNFLYNLVKSFYNYGSGAAADDPSQILCPTAKVYAIRMKNDYVLMPMQEETSGFLSFWTENRTAPLFVFLILFPLMNLKSPAFLVRFNALGPVAVVYIIVFALIHAFKWGLNVNISVPTDMSYMELFTFRTFYVLTGVLALAYHTHFTIIPVLERQKTLKYYKRNIAISYFLGMMTYFTIGLSYWLTFPLPKRCIADNLLKNFSDRYIFALIGRFLLFIQLSAIYPMLAYVIRTQMLTLIFKNKYPSFLHVLVLNVVVAALCLTFCMFYPRIGEVIRYVGAASGAVLVFGLPGYTYILIRKREGTLSYIMMALHIVLIIAGVLNLVGQFFGSG